MLNVRLTMVNTEIRQLRNSIIAMANDSPLPIEIKRLVFAEIQTQINAEADRIIVKEQQKIDESEAMENGN